MRHSVETRLANPELADSEFFARMSLAASGAPKDAPWDNLPPHLKAQVGSVNIDPAAQNEPKVFKRDFAAANSILAQAAGIHAHHKVFQWSYYYDATQQWWLVYPPQSRQELLTATNTTNMTSALKVLFDADGTLPVLAAGPKKAHLSSLIVRQARCFKAISDAGLRLFAYSCKDTASMG